MNSKKFQAIVSKVTRDLTDLLLEGEEKIIAALETAATEASVQDAPTKFKLGFVMTLDLDKNELISDLTFGTRVKLSTEAEIPDPEQIKLPLENVRN